MGAARSSYPVPEEAMAEIMVKYGLNDRHMGRLYQTFQRADLDRSGAVTIDEFYELIDEKRNVFGNEIFELLDTDTSGGLDFTEFVNAVCVFGFFGKMQMYQFCFYIFDKDKNGFISQDELKTLVTLLYSQGVIANLKAGLFRFDTDKDGVINFKEFVQMARQFPQMLHPAFEIQNKLQACTLGVKFFADIKAANAKGKAKKERERVKARDKKQREEERLAKEAEKEHKTELQEAERKRRAQQEARLQADQSGPKTKMAGLETAKVGPEQQAWAESSGTGGGTNTKKGATLTVDDTLNEDEFAAMTTSERRAYERDRDVVALATDPEEKMGRSELRHKRRKAAALAKATSETQGRGGKAAAAPKKKKSALAAPKRRNNRF